MKTKNEMIDGYMTRHTPEGQAIRAELENIWENGYNAGLLYNEKKINEEGTRQYNKGFANGVVAGKEMVLPSVDIYKEGYDKGADDARYELWWAIKKLYLNPSEDGLSATDVMGLFGEHHVFSDILRNYTPEEVIEKVKSYEESKKSAPTNYDKFMALFPSVTAVDIPRTFYFGENGFFIPDSWMDKPYEEPADGN